MAVKRLRKELLAHCRTGSLEMSDDAPLPEWLAHCRTGSLEKLAETGSITTTAHCRTGSLEIKFVFK